jgi:hypothetical protein
MGTLPDVPFGKLGVFRGLSGLRGDWSIPRRRYVGVDVGTLISASSIELARPEPQPGDELAWREAQPFAATARLVETDDLSAWQQGLVAATLALGIGGAILATLVLDWVRGRQEPAAPTEPTESGNDSGRRAPTEPTGLGNGSARRAPTGPIGRGNESERNALAQSGEGRTRRAMVLLSVVLAAWSLCRAARRRRPI